MAKLISNEAWNILVQRDKRIKIEFDRISGALNDVIELLTPDFDLSEVRYLRAFLIIFKREHKKLANDIFSHVITEKGVEGVKYEYNNRS